MAAICENVLQDKDGVMSLIRVIDAFSIQAKSMPTGESIPPSVMPFFQPTISFYIAIGFKAGDAKGRRRLRVILKSPSNNTIGETLVPFTFDTAKEPRGTTMVLPMSLAIKEDGMYWIDVFVNDVLMTRIPLRVGFDQPLTASSSSQAAP